MQLCTEWWFWEICALIVGYLGPNALAAHVANLQLIATCFMPTIGMNAACATLVGNSLGADLPRKARQATWLCVASNSCIWAMISVALWMSGDAIPKLYTSIETVQKIMLPLIHIFTLVGFTDTAQSIMSGSLRAMGRNNLAALTYAITFYFVMLPLGIAFAWPLHMGVNGIWWSMFVGTGLACTVFAVSLVFRTDWITIAADAAKNMNELGANARSEASQDGLSLSPADLVKVITEVESGS